jgi:hypothetical protein
MQDPALLYLPVSQEEVVKKEAVDVFWLILLFSWVG